MVTEYGLHNIIVTLLTILDYLVNIYIYIYSVLFSQIKSLCCIVYLYIMRECRSNESVYNVCVIWKRDDITSVFLCHFYCTFYYSRYDTTTTAIIVFRFIRTRIFIGRLLMQCFGPQKSRQW